MNSETENSEKSSTVLSISSLKPHSHERGLMIFLLVGIFIFSIGTFSLALRLKTHYSVSQFMPAGHPLLKADAEAREKFFLPTTQPIFVTLELQKGDWLETSRLRRLNDVTKEISTQKEVKQALSLATVSTANQSGTDLAVGTLLEITTEKNRRQRVLKDKFLNPHLVSSHAKSTILVINLKDEYTTTDVEEAISAARVKLESAFPEASVAIGGVPAIQLQLTKLVKSELVRFMALALLITCFSFLFVFSSYWSVVIPFAAIVLTNISVLAFMAWAGYSMTVLAVTIPILVSVTVLTLCVHTMIRFVEEVHSGVLKEKTLWSEKLQYVWQTLSILFVPNLLTSLTTCFGFATLMLTNVPVIREFGIAVAVAVMISWVCSTIVLAPLLVLLPAPVARPWILQKANWTAWIMKHRRLAASSVMVVCLVMTVVGKDLNWSTRLFDDLPVKEEARLTTEKIDRQLGGTIPFEILIEAKGVSDPWNEPKSIVALDQILKKVRQMPEVGSAVGLPDLLRASMGKPNARIPKERSAIAENWFLLSMSDDNPLRNFITADGMATRIGVRLKDEPSLKLADSMAAIRSQIQSAFPKAKVSTGGMATTVHQLNQELSSALLSGFWEALAVIMVLLLIVFRSVRWTFVASLPNLVPASVLIGTLALANTPIKPGVALVFSIALGIAFNNTVYLLQRLRALMEQNGTGPDQEVEHMLQLEGNPCLFSSVLILAGFAIFLLSEFGINQTFGMYMLISLFFGLIGDLVFLPALIKWCPWILVSTAKVAAENLTTLDSEEAIVALQESKTKEQKSLLPRAAAFVAAIFTAFSPVAQVSAANAQSADSILQQVEKRLSSKDEAARIKMKVVESNGTSKEREVEIKRKSGSKHQVLVRLKAPSDVSGVALLSVAKGGSEDQWLYMPSQKKARRVVSGNKSQRFLDTEFSLEDFSASTYSRFSNKILKEQRSPSSAIVVIESASKNDSGSSYSKILTWVDLKDYQVQKSEYYDRDGKILKTMVFRDYKKFGKAWRAQTVEVRNMQNKRSTVLKIAALKLNSGLSDREFTQSALEEE